MEGLQRIYNICTCMFLSLVDLIAYMLLFGLCWYQRGTNKKWTYDVTHLLEDLETIFILASMTYIVDLDAYELHLGMIRSSITLLMSARILHYTYMIEIEMLFKSMFVCLYMFMTTYEYRFLNIHIVAISGT